MKKQYIYLIISIVLLVISLIFLPIIGEILFIPFVYIFQYSCRSSNQRAANQQPNQPNQQTELLISENEQNDETIKQEENTCKMCGNIIPEKSLRYCEFCGSKLI